MGFFFLNRATKLGIVNHVTLLILVSSVKLLISYPILNCFIKKLKHW